ncbi:MAG: hypothetical protein ACYTEX_26780 [Planctomycetota bacterium]|jgi:hypothetical protein
MVSTRTPNEHAVVNGEIGAYIKRLSEKSGRCLAVILYRKLGVFCIVEFLSPNKDVFIDMMNLEQSLANFTRQKASELRKRLFCPVTCEETSRAIYEGESDYHHMRQDWNDEETERQERVAMGE